MSTPITWSPPVVGTTGQASQLDQFLAQHKQVYMNQGVTALSGGFSGYTTVATNTGSAAQWIDQPFLSTTTQMALPRIDIAVAGPSGPTTTIAAGSNGVSLPTPTISVASTTGFPSSGVVAVATNQPMPQFVQYGGFGQTPALVQKATFTGTVNAGATYSATFGVGTTAGNLLVAYSGDFLKPAVPTPPGGWTTAFSQSDSSGQASQILAYLPNNGGGITTVTWTSTSATNDQHDLIIAEFSGVATATPLDQQTSNVHQPAAPYLSMTTPSATTQGVELVLGCFMDESTPNSNTFAPGVGYTTAAYSGGSQFMEFAYSTGTGVQTATATLNASGGVFDGWMGGIVTFKANTTGTAFAGCIGGAGVMSTNNAVNITAADTTLSLTTDANGYISSSGFVGSNPSQFSFLATYASSINLLSAVNASLETGLGQWNNDTNVTVSQTTAQALDGTHSLQMSSNAAGTMKSEPVGINGTTAVPVTGGATYSASAYFRAQSVARSCQVAILWYNLDGSFNNFALGTGVNDTTTGWTQATIVSAVAPAAAAFGVPQVVVNSTAGAAEIHYVDQIMFNAGSSVTWAIPSGSATDPNAAWAVNQWAGKTVWAPAVSPEFPSTGVVASNTATTLTLTGSWVPSVPAGAVTTIPLDIYGTPSNTVLASTVIPFDFVPTGITTIAAGSNGVALPAATINVVSTSGFTAQGQLLVTNNNGQPQLVNYTGITATSFTGCAFGTGTMATGGAVVAARQLSVPINATLYPNTNYHLVFSGTTSTTNYTRLLCGQARNANLNTGTSANGPWTQTANTLVFATFTGNGGVLRNVYEDNGAKWTEYEYLTAGGSSGPPSGVFEYNGSLRSGTYNSYVGGVLLSSSTQNTLSPTTWVTPQSGTSIKATQINQLLGTHQSQYWYFGPVVDQIATATTGTVKTNGGAAQWVACAFNTGTFTSVGLVQLGLANVGTGSDITVELRTNNAGVPSNTVLASVVVPLDFIGSALSYAVAGTTGWLSIPLLATGLSTNTVYWVVVDGTSSATNYVTVAQTTAVASKHTFTSASGTGTWVDTGNSAPITVLRGNDQPSGALMGTIEDYTLSLPNGTQSVIGPPTRWTGYRYGVSSANMNQPPDAVGEYQGTFRDVRTLRYGNFLSYAQSQMESASIFNVSGGWTIDTNVTVSQTANQFQDGSHSMQMSSNAAGTMTADCCVAFGPNKSTGQVVVPGQVTIATAWVRAATAARQCQLATFYYKSDGTTGIAGTIGTAVTNSTSAWTQISVISTAPSLAAFVALQVNVLSTAGASEIHYVDNVFMSLLPRGTGLTEII